MLIEHVISLLSFLRCFSLFVRWSKSHCPLECGEDEKETLPPLNETLSVFIEAGCFEEILQVVGVSLRLHGALQAEVNLLCM